jgi:hypothetical protein
MQIKVSVLDINNASYLEAVYINRVGYHQSLGIGVFGKNVVTRFE